MAKRTSDQNRALHKGCDLIAKALNDAGQDMRKVLKPEIDIPWTFMSVKEHLFKPIMKAMYHIDSTTELEKLGQIDEVWDVLLRHLNKPRDNGEPILDEYIEFPHDPNKISNYPQ